MRVEDELTIGEVRARGSGFVRRCSACDHSRIFPATQVMCLPFPDELLMDTVVERLKCEKCGARSFRIEFTTP